MGEMTVTQLVSNTVRHRGMFRTSCVSISSVSFVFIFIFLSASPRSGRVLVATLLDGCYDWLILGIEGGESLVEGGCCHLYRCYGDLLGGEEDLVSRFEDVFVGGVVEWHIADMCPNVDR